MQKGIIYLLIISVVLVVLIAGCDSNEYLVSESKYHPQVWNKFPAADSHAFESLKNGFAECYRCHGHDLSGGIAEVACSECHGGGLDDCTACHGGLNDSTGAPPYDLNGGSSDTSLAVGAHSSHVNGSLISDGVPCVACHVVPEHPWEISHYDFSLYDSVGVIDSVAEITWGSFVNSDGVWNRETKSCSNIYCHGNINDGYKENAPVWTGTDQAACGSCHNVSEDIFQMNRGHIVHFFNEDPYIDDKKIGCERCHANTVDADCNIIGQQYHIDGFSTVKFSPDLGSFSNSSCEDAGGCHGYQIWD